MNNKKITPVIHDVDWAKELETAYGEYKDTLAEIEFNENSGEPAEPTLSGELFCGCHVCWHREELYFLVPSIIQGYLAGKVGIKVEE